MCYIILGYHILKETMILIFICMLFRELKLPESCLNNEDNVEVKGFKFDSLTEELREKRYYICYLKCILTML